MDRYRHGDLTGWLALAAGALLLLAAGRWVVAGQLGEAAATGSRDTVATPARLGPALARRCPAPTPARADARHPGPPAPVASEVASFRETPQRTGAAATGGPAGRPAVRWRATGLAVVFSSPVAAGKLVVVGGGDGGVHAVEAATGRPAWGFATGGPVDASPAVAGQTVYSTSADGNLYALDLASGALRWCLAIDAGLSSPAVAGGLVVVSSRGGTLYGISAYGVSAADGRVLWQRRVGASRQASPAVAGGVVYAGGGDGTLHALDLATGKPRWRFQGDGSIAACPVVGDGMVYAVDLTGTLHALTADRGVRRWQQHVGVAGQVLIASPALARGVLYLAADGGLLAVDAASGRTVWRRPGIGAVSSPTVAAGTVYVGSGDGHLHAVGAADGRPRWRVRLGGGVHSTPAVRDGAVYVGGGAGGLYALGEPPSH
ncbi:MAG TPA: PQQ-binding-like beta-propeller repeat protein [Actinomycetes bacterium]|jgi:outer membrane protein assembly factor BamB|nr:PQQ-binding-like beta-propeller repeat protein [Actinomycetes bacterium]